MVGHIVPSHSDGFSASELLLLLSSSSSPLLNHSRSHLARERSTLQHNLYNLYWLSRAHRIKFMQLWKRMHGNMYFFPIVFISVVVVFCWIVCHLSSGCAWMSLVPVHKCSSRLFLPFCLLWTPTLLFHRRSVTIVCVLT